MESLNPASFQYKERGAEKLYYLSHKLWNKKLFVLANFIKRLNTFLFRNYIPPSVKIGKRLQLPHGGFGVIMHKDVKIGNDAIIFQNVTIGNGGITIGDRVCLGAGAVILGDHSIGDDAFIGANTFVNFSIPAGATVAGQKGRIIKRRETVE